MQQIKPDKLTDALRIHTSKHPNDGLYIVSMDHCPSEQLTGEDWHTTVLVLSAGMEHAELARRLAQRLRPRMGTLTKWTNATGAYRRNFLKEFFKELAVYPVCVLGLSAQESSIWKSVSHFIRELGLDGRYQRTEGHGKGAKVSLGPLVRASTGETFTPVLSEKRAAMCLFVAHFVLRMHRHMYEAVNASSPDRPSHVNWNFFGDRFPGPPDGDMALMFQILSVLDRSTGRILWGHFTEGDVVETDLLADNLAGVLNEAARMADKYGLTALPCEARSEGFFYWERWTKPRTPMVLAIGAFLFAAVLTWPAVSEFLAVDGCLDAGGSFDYALGRCDFVTNHPSRGVWEGHVLSLSGALVFALATLGALFSDWKLKGEKGSGTVSR